MEPIHLEISDVLTSIRRGMRKHLIQIQHDNPYRVPCYYDNGTFCPIGFALYEQIGDDVQVFDHIEEHLDVPSTDIAALLDAGVITSDEPELLAVLQQKHDELLDEDECSVQERTEEYMETAVRNVERRL